MEWVAYQLNLMLGMDYVPPVAYLHNVDIPGHGRFDSGAMLCTWSGCLLIYGQPQTNRLV